MIQLAAAAVAALMAFGAAIHTADVLVEFQSGMMTGAKAIATIVVMVVTIFLLVDYAAATIGDEHVKTVSTAR